MNRVTWANGTFADDGRASIPIDDPGARFGDGLRETLRVENGSVPWIARHLERLERSTHALGYRGNIAPIGEIDEVIRAVAAQCSSGTWQCTVLVSPGPSLIVDAVRVSVDPSRVLSAITCPGLWIPDSVLAEHKTIAFLTSRLALRRAADANADMAILVDGANNLGETATANIFVVVDGAVLTPPLHGILPGTTRAAILELTDAIEAPIPAELWQRCDEMFMTNAVHHVVAIGTVDGMAIGNGDRGPVTRRFQRIVDEAFHG